VAEYETDQDRQEAARREFLRKCGKLAAVTPPAITLLLSMSDRSFASASSGSGGRHGGQHRKHDDHRNGDRNGKEKGGRRKDDEDGERRSRRRDRD
jgi:hypothetical protein